MPWTPQWPFGETGVVAEGITDELIVIPDGFIELLIGIDAGPDALRRTDELILLEPGFVGWLEETRVLDMPKEVGAEDVGLPPGWSGPIGPAGEV